MRTMKMWAVIIRIKKNDTVKGKRVHVIILDILKKGKISGATVWTGTGGYGKRGESNVHVEGNQLTCRLLLK